jgi:transcriptional regulator with XRE-family HTH domain
MTIPEADAKQFGRNLCLARRRRGLSQEALARRSGLSRDGIYKLEMGRRSPRLGTLLALADALNVAPGELLEGLR